MFQLLLIIYLLPVVIIVVLLIRFIRWLLSLALRSYVGLCPELSALPCACLWLSGKEDVAYGGITVAGLHRRKFCMEGK